MAPRRAGGAARAPPSAGRQEAAKQPAGLASSAAAFARQERPAQTTPRRSVCLDAIAPPPRPHASPALPLLVLWLARAVAAKRAPAIETDTVWRSMFIRAGAARSRRPRGRGAGPRPAHGRRRIRARVAGRPGRFRGPG